jgi:hypothetical protein
MTSRLNNISADGTVGRDLTQGLSAVFRTCDKRFPRIQEQLETSYFSADIVSLRSET